MNRLFLFAFLLLGLQSIAQNSKLISPEVNADQSITFRLKTYTASSVKVKGSWMKDTDPALDMVKKDSVWTYTTAPIPGDFYRYNFIIDGVEITDPLNAYVERAGLRHESVVISPGEQSAWYQPKAVPHGMLSALWYPSPSLGYDRRMNVYTPPSYLENPNRKYPVLYLLHGAGGDENAWVSRGPVATILDNLIAAGKAKEMIVVVTNGYPGKWSAPNVGPSNSHPKASETASMANGQFEASLVNEVIPFIEKRFRVLANRENRAIAGFSMGGLQTQHITNAHPELFDYIAVMSMGLMNDKRIETYQPEIHTPQVKALIKSKPKLYWIGTGKEDFLFESIVNLRKKYDEMGLKYEYVETSGGHTWSNWSLYLSMLAPKFFQP